MDAPKVPPLSAVRPLAGLLDSAEIAALVSELEATRWTGRPGYPIRTMVGLALAKSIYALPTWTKTVALVREHAALRAVVGCRTSTDVPSIDACYRFTRKLIAFKPLLHACLDHVTDALRAAHPAMGQNIAIDGSDLPAYGNGQRFLSENGPERERYSDPDASWGHRSAVSTRKGGGFNGYKVHAAVCAITGLPVAWTVETAIAAETNFALPLIDAARERGFAVNVAIADKGYDNGPFHDGCMDRNAIPVTPLRETYAVKRGDHHAPMCEHGMWKFAGADYKRKATKWRCPTGGCQPKSRWIKANRLHPTHPARVRAVAQVLPVARRGRARVRPPQARVGAAAAPSSRLGSREASRRPDDLDEARLRVGQGARSRSACGIGFGTAP